MIYQVIIEDTTKGVQLRVAGEYNGVQDNQSSLAAGYTAMIVKTFQEINKKSGGIACNDKAFNIH